MPLPDLDQLKRRVAGLAPEATPFTRTVYRSSTPEYGNETELLNGEGSRRNGGRWNAPGIPAVYASLTPETAMAETLAHYRYYGIPLEESMPRIFVAIRVQLQFVLDLRRGSLRQRLGISLVRMLDTNWRLDILGDGRPLTHLLSEAVLAAGLEAMIVPSAADREGANVVVFPTNLLSTSIVQLLNPQRLARP